jgi:hypothetical protein
MLKLPALRWIIITYKKKESGFLLKHQNTFYLLQISYDENFRFYHAINHIHPFHSV